MGICWENIADFVCSARKTLGTACNKDIMFFFLQSHVPLHRRPRAESDGRTYRALAQTIVAPWGFLCLTLMTRCHMVVATGREPKYDPECILTRIMLTCKQGSQI